MIQMIARDREKEKREIDRERKKERERKRKQEAVWALSIWCACKSNDVITTFINK